MRLKFLSVFLLLALSFQLLASPLQATCYDSPPGGYIGKTTPTTPCGDGRFCTDPQECSTTTGASTPTCDNGNGTPTALGCIPNDPAQAIPKILNWAIGVGGGIGFLLLLYGAFTLITAGPNPEKVEEGKSIITSAIGGLLFIIFSVVLLKVIGINILGL